MSDEPENPSTIPTDPYDIKVKGKDPWRVHPAKKVASLLIMLALFYLMSAGFLAGLAKRSYQEEPGWLGAFMAPTEMVAGFSGLYSDYLDWQKGLFAPKSGN